MEIIRYLMGQLHIKTKLVLLSELSIEARGDQMIIEICKKLGASHFLAQHATKKYINEHLFQLEYFKPPSLIYPQLWGDFIPNLSTFDILFNCGPKARDILIEG